MKHSDLFLILGTAALAPYLGKRFGYIIGSIYLIVSVFWRFVE